jgi:hypothetical protein
MPRSPVKVSSSEADSFTGISSGTETIATPVRSWSVMNLSSSCAWEWIGPTRAMLAKVRGVCRKPIPWPVAGASTITRSYSSAFFTLRSGCASSQIFPIVTSSLRPGVAAAR